MSTIHRTTAWINLARKMRGIWGMTVDSGNALCVDCGKPIYPGQTWEVGHILAASTHPELALQPWNLGPSHQSCNRKAGGKLGAIKTNAARARAKGKTEESGAFPRWY